MGISKPTSIIAALSLFLLSQLQTASAQYSATYLPGNIPQSTEQGQSGFNRCNGTTENQSSKCQTAYVNSIDDFCVWGPPEPGSTVGATEPIVVAWCTKPGHGTRLIPKGAIQGAHFLQTPDYVQVTGVGDFTFLNIQAGDEGGELDPHGPTGFGNPVGGVVFSTAFTGQPVQTFEWTNFMSYNQFCIRACKPDGDRPRLRCNHIYDVIGCRWNIPGNYDAGVYETCRGEDTPPMGIYGDSTFQQGQPFTPAGHPPAPSSQCTTTTPVGVLAAAISGFTGTAPAGFANATSSSSSSSSSTSSVSTITSARPSGSGASVLGGGAASNVPGAPTTSARTVGAAAASTGDLGRGFVGLLFFGLSAVVLGLLV